MSQKNRVEYNASASKAVVVESAVVVDEPVAIVPVESVVVEEKHPTPVVQPTTQTEFTLPELFASKVTEFKTTYPVNRVLDMNARVAMVKSIESLVNILQSGKSDKEIATMISLFREALFKNEGNVFNRARILGQMRDPRSGQLRVQYERTVNLLTLLYITADPSMYASRRGKMDVAQSVIGFREETATSIIRYFN